MSSKLSLCMIPLRVTHLPWFTPRWQRLQCPWVSSICPSLASALILTHFSGPTQKSADCDSFFLLNWFFWFSFFHLGDPQTSSGQSHYFFHLSSHLLSFKVLLFIQQLQLLITPTNTNTTLPPICFSFSVLFSFSHSLPPSSTSWKTQEKLYLHFQSWWQLTNWVSFILTHICFLHSLIFICIWLFESICVLSHSASIINQPQYPIRTYIPKSFCPSQVCPMYIDTSHLIYYISCTIFINTHFHTSLCVSHS